MGVVVRVEEADFDAGAELARLRAASAGVGAIASFTGLVRDTNEVAGSRASVGALTLEHYPGMTERALAGIGAKAVDRFALLDLVVVHRVGTLAPGDQIVFVAASAPHRAAAFAACDFVMDFLKTEAPFWKKEATPDGERWVDARASDLASAGRWTRDPA